MSATELVQNFLRKMEARDLEAAEALMASDAVIAFPGGRQFSSQSEMVRNAAGRYQWVKKTFDQIDHLKREDGAEVVYVMGMLYGVNKHGVAFKDIRYIDRFVVRDGKITEQHVWNDLAESGVLERQTQEATT
jgi:ketosteroid isomerase-like protein